MLNFNNVRPNRRVSYAHLPRVEHYEYLGDGLNIQIHSKNQRFIKRIKEAYGRLKENPIGIRLVDDIRKLRARQEDQCWIVECNYFERIQTDNGIKFVYELEKSSFLYKTDEQIGERIYIDIDQNFHYYGFHKDDLKGKHPNEIIPLKRFVSGPDELDITLFHEMNHFRHYLQIGREEYDRKQTQFSKYNDKEKHMIFMYSDEELLQLTGTRLDGKHDAIYEMLYRAHRANTPIRYPYSNYEPSEYVKSRATAGYFSDLLTSN